MLEKLNREENEKQKEKKTKKTKKTKGNCQDTHHSNYRKEGTGEAERNPGESLLH